MLKINRNRSRYIWKTRIEKKTKDFYKVYRYYLNGLQKEEHEIGDIQREGKEHYYYIKYNSVLPFCEEDLEALFLAVKKLNKEENDN